MRSRTPSSRATTLLLLLGALACATGYAAAPAEPPREQVLHESWDLLTMGGAKLGYTHSIARKVADPQPQIATSTFSQVRMKRFGVTMTLRVSEEYRETLDGVLISARSSTTGGGAASDSEAKIQGDRVIVTTHTAGTSHVSEIAWDPEAIGPEAEARRLRESGFAPGKEITSKMLVLDLNKIVRSTTRIEGRETATIQGKPRELFKGKTTLDALPGVVTQVWLDESGDVVKSSMALMGDVVETVRVSREEAVRAAAAAANLDKAMKGFDIPSDVKIERPRSVTEALYRIEGPIGGLNLEERRQKIEGSGPDWALLRVKALADAPEAQAEKPGPEYLKASAFIQSDDADLQRVARENTDPKASPAANARRLEEWVFKAIRTKDYAIGFASAKETLIAREGDCTEHAVLLASLLRAAKIPARVAVGVIYSEGRFYGHMWTEAFLNDWTALDATLNAEVVDACHIRMAATALDGPSPAAAFLGFAQSFGNMKIIVQDTR